MYVTEEKSTIVEARRKMQETLQLITRNTPPTPFLTDEVAGTDIRIGHIDGKPVERLVIHLRSNGCGWKKSGGCAMCGFWNETTQMGQQVTTEDFVAQFEGVIHKFDMSRYPILNIYNAGSILNEQEVPFEALEEILSLVSRMPAIKEVVLESRVEYANSEKIRRVQEILQNKRFVLGIGLESSNDLVRDLCIHKGLSRSHFESHIDSMRSLGVIPRVYVLIKPPFLTEGEAIEDAVFTTKYLVDLGVEEIHFETMTIEEHTLVHLLYKTGYYRLPWLWSIIEIIKQVSSFANPFVNPFRYIAQSKENPHNCALCSERVTDALLHDYCLNYNVDQLSDLDCTCKSRWLEEINGNGQNRLQIEERVLHILSEVTSTAAQGCALELHRVPSYLVG